MSTATPSSPASVFGLPQPHRLPRRCLLPQPLFFTSRWVLPADSRIRCGPRLSVLEDQISLWLPGCDGKLLGNGAPASWRPGRRTGVKQTRGSTRANAGRWELGAGVLSPTGEHQCGILPLHSAPRKSILTHSPHQRQKDEIATGDT